MKNKNLLIIGSIILGLVLLYFISTTFSVTDSKCQVAKVYHGETQIMSFSDFRISSGLDLSDEQLKDAGYRETYEGLKVEKCISSGGAEQ